MKRRALVKHLGQYGCYLVREGKKHSVYKNPRNQQLTTIPRHTEIKDKLVLKICKDLGIPSP